MPAVQYVPPSPSVFHFQAPNNVESSQSTDPSTHEFIERVRNAASTPTPLANILQNPKLLRSLSKSSRSSSRKHRERSSSSSREPHRRDASGSTSSSTMLSTVLAKEEAQAQHLKSVLHNTSDRLEYEIARADREEARAEHAEMRAKEATARIAHLELNSQVNATKATEEARRFQLQLDNLERELRRVNSEMMVLQRQKKDAEEDAERARESARHFEMLLRDHEAREEGREEGRQIRMQQLRDEGWQDGEAEGYESGRLDGFDEGFEAGRAEGFEDGRRKGRKEEREATLQAFDQFLAEETATEAPSITTLDRTRRWVDSMYRSSRNDESKSPTPKPRPRPSGLRRVTATLTRTLTGTPRSR